MIQMFVNCRLEKENPTNNFKFKNCLSGAINLVQNSDKRKYVYSG